jgi:hypothetical protein
MAGRGGACGRHLKVRTAQSNALVSAHDPQRNRNRAGEERSPLAIRSNRRAIVFAVAGQLHLALSDALAGRLVRDCRVTQDGACA